MAFLTVPFMSAVLNTSLVSFRELERLKTVRTVDVRVNSECEFSIEVLRKQAQAMKLLAIADMPKHLLQYANLESYPSEFEPQDAAPEVPNAALVLDVGLLEVQAEVDSKPEFPRTYAGPARPRCVRSAKWTSIGSTTREKFNAWIAEHPEAAGTDELEFHNIMSKLQLGKKVKPETKQTGPAISSSSSSSAQLPAMLADICKQTKPVYVIEFACCDKSTVSANAESFGFSSFRLTKQYADLSTKAGFDKVRTLLLGLPIGCVVHFHGACPCAAWCPWHFINVKKNPSFWSRLCIMRIRSLQMVHNFCSLTKIVTGLNPKNTSNFEWPRYSVGWKQKTTEKGLTSAGLVHIALLDGCALGVVSSAQIPIKKPWKIRSTSKHVTDHLDQFKCPGVSESHVHAKCQGSDTVKPGFYPNTMAKQISTAFKIHMNSTFQASLLYQTVQLARLKHKVFRSTLKLMLSLLWDVLLTLKQSVPT